jgi:hypothetical protein
VNTPHGLKKICVGWNANQSNIKFGPTSRVRKKAATLAIIRFFTIGVIMYLKPKLVVE